MSTATILVIEDAEEMRDLIGNILSRFGYQVEQARDGLEGLKMAQALRPTLVILDLMMPMASGDLTLGYMRSTPGLKEIPVIVMSAHPKADTIAEKLGAQAILRKPFEMRELRALIQTLIPPDPQESVPG